MLRRGAARLSSYRSAQMGRCSRPGDGCRRFGAPRVTALSNIGAGDSMLAGILVTLERGWALDEAARFGVAAGTAALLRRGTELCRREDAEQLYRAAGHRRNFYDAPDFCARRRRRVEDNFYRSRP